MKKIIIIATVLFACKTVQAKIWRCNNNAGITADFTTLQAAHDAAASGDTIHLEPSLATYGNLTMTKKLTIISTGSFIGDNPGYQADTKAGFCGSITINNAAANGSTLSVRFNGQLVARGATVANITFINCASTIMNTHHLDGQGMISIEESDNCIIAKSWATNINIRPNANGHVVTNNIIGNGIVVDGTSSCIISNNVIHAIVVHGFGADAINNSTVSNNIYVKGLESASFPNCTVRNNFNSTSSGNMLPAGNGNVNGVDMTTVFVDGTGVFVDNAYILKAGSPAIGAGDGGIDCGAFGGSSPYVLAATPTVPSIYKLQVPATPSGNSMNVVFSTRSN